MKRHKVLFVAAIVFFAVPSVLRLSNPKGVDHDTNLTLLRWLAIGIFFMCWAVYERLDQ